MAEFVESLDGFKPFLSPYLMDLDPSLEIMSQFGELSEGVMENPSLGMMGFSNESYLSQPQEFSMPFEDRLPRMPAVEHVKPAVELQRPSDPVREQEQSQGSKKRKARVGAESSTENSSSVLTGVKEDNSKKRNSSGGGKRGRNNSSKDGEGPKEVVHVRARRGQATDSHSLAERVRREKINERMRCLQGLVPGCYKTMGMAVMLDEIINYVQSLQNQVEFLSMKLSAASSFCDLDSDREAMAAPQVFPRVGNAYNEEAQEVERLVREGYGGCTSFHSSMPF